jgi:SAM-dependent methyltransferase
MSEENIATEWDPIGYDQNARFVSDLGEPVLQLLNPKPGEKVLDLGCGDGELTLKLMDAGCHVIAVDSSPAMVASSLAKGINARVMDGQHLEFEGVFDAVFSNAALHWMTQPKEVIAGVKRALKPSGRFVAEMGGLGNVASVLAALTKTRQRRGLAPVNPWYFPSVEDYRQLLEAAGFQVPVIQLIQRPTVLSGALRGWLETFAVSFLITDGAGREEMITEVNEELAPTLCDDSGKWTVDYVRLRFVACDSFGLD